MMENKNRLSVIIIVGVFLIVVVFFGLNYFLTYQELQTIKTTQVKVELNQKVLNFTSLFIKEVLQAEGEVDFETRLTLENAVRELKDEKIMSEWQNFVNSKTESSAQTSVKNLLGILVDKIQK